MNRREFLKKSLALGSSALGIGFIASIIDKSNKNTNQTKREYQNFTEELLKTNSGITNQEASTNFTSPEKDTFFEQLTKDVKSAPYDLSDYKLGSFDCTNEGALLYDCLKKKGYEVKVVLGSRDSNILDYNNHMLLLVGKVNGVKYTQDKGEIDVSGYWIEPTTKEVFKTLPEYCEFEVMRVYEDYRDIPWIKKEFIYPSDLFKRCLST